MILLVSFVNQSFTPDLKLGLLDTDSDQFNWITEGCAGISNGATGIAVDGELLYVCIQQSDLLVYGPDGLQQRFELTRTKDPHSLLLLNDELYCVSSGTNELVRLSRDSNGHLCEEEVFWRFPETTDEYDEVHLNSIAHDGSQFVVTGFGRRTDPAQSWAEIREGFLMTESGDYLRREIKHPHSVYHGNGEIYYCESLEGTVQALHSGRTYQRRGYTRGLVLEADTLIVGSSHRRKISKSTARLMKGRTGAFETGRSGCQITLLDADTGNIRKEIDLAAFGNEIYEICPAPQFILGLAEPDPIAMRVRSFEKHSAELLQRAATGIEDERARLQDIHKERLSELESTHEGEREQLTQQILTSEARAKSLQSDQEALNAELKSMAERKDELETELATATSDLTFLTEHRDTLRTNLQTLEVEREALTNEISELKALRTELETERDGLHEAILELSEASLLKKRQAYLALLARLDEESPV